MCVYMDLGIETKDKSIYRCARDRDGAVLRYIYHRIGRQ